MKQLLAGIVIIVVLGLAGFFWRNTLERTQGPKETACTMDARVCPDGTTVGRSGPSCDFSPCLYPNVEIASAEVAYAVPAGYEENKDALGDPSMLAAYEQTGTSTPPNAIIVYRFPIPAGQTANDVIIANTMLEPSGMQPDDMNDFRPRIIGTKTFSSITVERFEAIVHSAYYLPRETDVLRFDVVERDVEEWTDADLIVSNLPEHQALMRMLGTLEDRSQAQ